MLGIISITYENENSIFNINIKEKKLSYMNIVKEITEDSIFNYLESLLRIISTWKEEYLDSTTIDGFNWNLIIRYEDLKIKKYSGHADTPLNFEAFISLNQDLIDEVI